VPSIQKAVVNPTPHRIGVASSNAHERTHQSSIPAHLAVTVDGPITLQTASSRLCIPSTSSCLPSDAVPLLSVAGVIVAALIAGRHAVHAATKTAAGALAAAQEQARAAQEAALKQSGAALEAQRIALRGTADRERENRERASLARRKRLAPLLKDLARGYATLGTIPGAADDKKTMTWRVEQLQTFAADDRLIELLTADEADALHEAVDRCKSTYNLLLEYDATIRKTKNDTQANYYAKLSQRQARIALSAIRSVVVALHDPVGEALVDGLLNDLPDPDTRKAQSASSANPGTSGSPSASPP